MQGMHVYYTAFEFLAERLQKVNGITVAAWRVQFFTVHESERPLVRFDPACVEIENMPGVPIEVRDMRPAHVQRGGRQATRRTWAAALAAIADEVSDSHSGSDKEDSETQGENDDEVKGEGVASGHEYSEEPSSPASSESSTSSSGSSSGGASNPSRFAAASGSGASAAAAPPSESLNIETTPPAAVPAKGVAERAQPVARRPRADFELQVPGGTLRYYEGTNSVVAHCFRHGSQECRLTRTMNASTARGRAGQGRPIGLLCAWLEAGMDPALRTAEAHKQMRPFPTFEQRRQARASVASVLGIQSFFDRERPPRPDEGAEPSALP